MQRSPLANRFATILSTVSLCALRANPIPESLFLRMDQAMKILKEIRDGQGLLPGASCR